MKGVEFNYLPWKLVQTSVEMIAPENKQSENLSPVENGKLSTGMHLMKEKWQTIVLSQNNCLTNDRRRRLNN